MGNLWKMTQQAVNEGILPHIPWKGWLEDYFPFDMVPFQVTIVTFRRGMFFNVSLKTMEGRPVCLIRLHSQWQDLLNHWIYFHTRKITQHHLPDNPLYTFKTKASDTIHISKLWIKHHLQRKKNTTNQRKKEKTTPPHLRFFPRVKKQSANQNKNTTKKKSATTNSTNFATPGSLPILWAIAQSHLAMRKDHKVSMIQRHYWGASSPAGHRKFPGKIWN